MSAPPSLQEAERDGDKPAEPFEATRRERVGEKRESHIQVADSLTPARPEKKRATFDVSNVAL
jgi:hypothetical protein